MYIQCPHNICVNNESDPLKFPQSIRYQMQNCISVKGNQVKIEHWAYHAVLCSAHTFMYLYTKTHSKSKTELLRQQKNKKLKPKKKKGLLSFVRRIGNAVFLLITLSQRSERYANFQIEPKSEGKRSAFICWFIHNWMRKIPIYYFI